MSQSASVWMVLGLALLAANLPFLNERLLGLVPLAAGTKSLAIRLAELVLLYAVVSLSLTVAIGWAGQVSLGQFALVGCGAFVAGHLMPAGWSVLFLLLVCGVVGAAVMALVAMPALRVPGLTLAVTTLGAQAGLPRREQVLGLLARLPKA